MCSIDGGEQKNCTLPLTLTAAEVGVGEHTVAFTLTDVCGDTAEDSVYLSWNEPLPPPGRSAHYVLLYHVASMYTGTAMLQVIAALHLLMQLQGGTQFRL